MQITETSVLTRANTSISWPGDGYTLSANNLLPSRQGIDYIKEVHISDDQLTITNITTWNNLQTYLEVKLSASVEDQTNWFTTSCVPGLTIVKTIETSA